MATLASSLVAYQSASAQNPAPSAILLLTVGDAGSRDFLPDVELRLSGAAITARTDRFGEARLSGIEAGSHDIIARRFGYIPRSVSFTAQVGDTLRLLLLLDRAPRSLDTIRVSAGARKAFLLGFQERRQATHAYFLDETQIDSTTWLNNLPAALAMRLPWLAVGEDSHGLPYLRTTHKGTCGPVLFLDGHELTDRTEIWTVMARELAGVEYYDDGGAAPPAFQRPRSGIKLCSIMLLWSR